MQAVPIPGRYSGALVVHTDITVERRRERDWQHRALHDQLTGLPNRTLLMDRLEHAVATAARGSRSVAVLFVDLDAFKSVNDTFGHPAGDYVLTESARRMAESVRGADTIGRWGGDEFVVIAEGLDHCTTAADVAGRLAKSLAAPIRMGRSRVKVAASVGICYLEGDQDGDDLIAAANADLQALRQRRYR
jgi:diguanylate cyclase (GGDEF)-like protein